MFPYGGEGRRIRRSLRCSAGQCDYVADYSQIELRIMAHGIGDAVCSKRADGEDVHRATAAEILASRPMKSIANSVVTPK